MLPENNWVIHFPIPRWSSDLKTAYKTVRGRIIHALSVVTDPKIRYLLLDLTHVGSLSGITDEPDLLLEYGIPDNVLGQSHFSWTHLAERPDQDHIDPTYKWVAENCSTRIPTDRSVIEFAGILKRHRPLVAETTPETATIAIPRLLASQDYRRLLFSYPDEQGHSDYVNSLALITKSVEPVPLLNPGRLTDVTLNAMRDQCLLDIDPIVRWNRTVALGHALYYARYHLAITASNSPLCRPIAKQLAAYTTFITKDLPHVRASF